MEKKVRNRIFEFFVESNDFNGIPLRNISDEFKIEYKESIELIKKLVLDNSVSIQSSTNPHIIGFRHFPTIKQLKILDDAKSTTISVEKFGEILIQVENTEYPICLYPSQAYLKEKRNIQEYKTAEYSKLLALGEPKLSPRFFEIEVLERYSNDPRFDFKFEDYSGSISCKYDENNKPIVRKEDQIFLKTFGLGFDSKGNRLAVVYLNYLKDLTAEHQSYWKSKEVIEDCNILEEYYENTIKGNWSFSHSIFSAFIGELKCLNDLSIQIFGIKVFKNSFDGINKPKEFTFFFIPTLDKYNKFVMLLDKMISDNINEKFFRDKIELFKLVRLENNLVEKRHKGTLQLFQDWLSLTHNYSDDQLLINLFKPFRKVRKERQEPAHRIADNKYDLVYIKKQKELINSCYSSMKNLRHIFQQHPKAKDIKIPDWLDKGEIKIF